MQGAHLVELGSELGTRQLVLAHASAYSQLVARARKSEKAAVTTIRLKPANPFELIRWLARSQSDPRKAVAELVQNSLDAGATHVVIERRRVKRQVTLAVRDNGEGVLPAMEREAALRYLAQHIGHSHKLRLDPAERHRRVIAGKYGVGLLGFWAIGKRFELRSRVDGSDVWCLGLEEDSPKATIAKQPRRTDSERTFTEAVVLGVHDSALRSIGGRRLTDYLAAELRGQLLRREITLDVVDRLARGKSRRHFEVTPQRFLGQPLDLPTEFLVKDHSPIHVELYQARGAEDPTIQIACAGTLVADSISDLRALELKRAPWIGHDLTGILDFADFTVPPGSRRGVLPDSAAQAFATALGELAPIVLCQLDEFDQQRRKDLNRDVLRELRRALKDFRKKLPQYELPTVEGAKGAGAEDDSSAGDPGVPLPKEPTMSTSSLLDSSIVGLPLLRGSLANVILRPKALTIEPGTSRHIRATAADEHNNIIEGAPLCWTLADDEFELESTGGQATVAASPQATLGTKATLQVVATHDGFSAEATATIHVAEINRESAVGIPEPKLVSDADGRWRSRMSDERWEVNDAHADYIAIHSEHRSRVRYLVTLLAKEIAAQNSGHPEADEILESMVEVLAHAERNLRGK